MASAPKRVDQLERVDAGAQRLRHPPAVRRLDHRVDDHVGERHLAHELDAQHQHPRHPQVDDLARRREHVARVERVQPVVCVRPAQRRERPQAGRRTTCPARRGRAPARPSRTSRTPSGSDVRHRDVAVRAVPDRDLVAPPELAGDAPRPDLLHPVEEGVLLRLRVEAHACRCARPRSPAPPARCISQNHCSEISGSMRSPLRSQWPTSCSYGCSWREQPELEQPVDAPPAARRPRSARRTRRRPRSCGRRSRSRTAPRARAGGRSRSRWGRGPGVTLSAPVPKSIFTYSSAMIGTSRSTIGTIAVPPTRWR